MDAYPQFSFFSFCPPTPPPKSVHPYCRVGKKHKTVQVTGRLIPLPFFWTCLWAVCVLPFLFFSFFFLKTVLFPFSFPPFWETFFFSCPGRSATLRLDMRKMEWPFSFPWTNQAVRKQLILFKIIVSFLSLFFFFFFLFPTSTHHSGNMNQNEYFQPFYFPFIPSLSFFSPPAFFFLKCVKHRSDAKKPEIGDSRFSHPFFLFFSPFFFFRVPFFSPIACSESFLPAAGVRGRVDSSHSCRCFYPFFPPFFFPFFFFFWLFFLCVDHSENCEAIHSFREVRRPTPIGFFFGIVWRTIRQKNKKTGLRGVPLAGVVFFFLFFFMLLLFFPPPACMCAGPMRWMKRDCGYRSFLPPCPTFPPPFFFFPFERSSLRASSRTRYGERYRALGGSSVVLVFFFFFTLSF